MCFNIMITLYQMQDLAEKGADVQTAAADWIESSATGTMMLLTCAGCRTTGSVRYRATVQPDAPVAGQEAGSASGRGRRFVVVEQCERVEGPAKSKHRGLGGTDCSAVQGST